MIRTLVSIFLFSLVAPLTSAQTPESYIAVERYSKKVLLASGSEYKRPVASLTHLATAKVTLDWLKAAGLGSTTMVRVPNHTFFTRTQNPLGLQAGDRLSVRDALYATILTNDNVAAVTLANHVGVNLLQRRQLVGSPVALFVEEMNNLATSLGMFSTRFITASGDDFQKRGTRSTASDIARLSVHLATDTAFGFYAKQKQRLLRVVKRDGSEVSLTVVNSNKLLSSKFKVAGLKTGHSVRAGSCASIVANRNFYVEKFPTGEERVTPVQMVVVVLGSSDAGSFVRHVLPQAWSHYENWRKGGYMASPDRREFLKVTQ